MPHEDRHQPPGFRIPRSGRIREYLFTAVLVHARETSRAVELGLAGETPTATKTALAVVGSAFLRTAGGGTDGCRFHEFRGTYTESLVGKFHHVKISHIFSPFMLKVSHADHTRMTGVS